MVGVNSLSEEKGRCSIGLSEGLSFEVGTGGKVGAGIISDCRVGTRRSSGRLLGGVFSERFWKWIYKIFGKISRESGL